MLNIFADKKIDVSVLVPVFGTEGTLLRCLESVKKQVSDLFYIEIVVVDDCSNGRDGEGRSCREIVKAFKKSCSLPVKYVRHEQNKGAFESRRTAVYESKGRWLFMLDSDDYLKENSLAEIYRHAKETGAQIIHADAELITSIGGDFQKEMAEKVHNIHFGALKGQQIIQHFLIDMDITGFMWGKLYDRELIMNALEHIPLVSCTMAEDYLLFFWLAYECSVKEYTYLGVKDTVYVYCAETGVTSLMKIKTIEDWRKIVSTASVFTSIFSEIENLPQDQVSKVLTEEILDCVKGNCRSFLAHNIFNYRQLVIPELKPQAYEMLCDYWGRDFVEEIEAALEERAHTKGKC
ncbi:MAG: glycosyltransferase family 2 protein [Treponema sp.]|nr:glycosyltransferase family 2 protein [Treponema sp.]